MKIIKIIFKVIPSLFVTYFWLKYCEIRKKKMSRIKIYRGLKRFLEHVSYLFNIEFIVEGIENLPMEESYLLTPNHQSMIDPFLFFHVFNDPISFASKVSVKKMPIVRDFIKLVDGSYLERDNLRQEIKVMKNIQKQMVETNVKYIIFPEGTRTKDPDKKMNAFKPGALKFTMNSGKKIVPVALHGTSDVLNTKVKRKKYPVYVSFLEPITKEDYESLSSVQVSELVQSRIQTKLDQIIEREKNNN